MVTAAVMGRSADPLASLVGPQVRVLSPRRPRRRDYYCCCVSITVADAVSGTNGKEEDQQEEEERYNFGFGFGFGFDFGDGDGAARTEEGRRDERGGEGEERRTGSAKAGSEKKRLKVCDDWDGEEGEWAGGGARASGPELIGERRIPPLLGCPK